jgi:hypothetical protein
MDTLMKGVVERLWLVVNSVMDVLARRSNESQNKKFRIGMTYNKDGFVNE